jgi:hypothetical protein
MAVLSSSGETDEDDGPKSSSSSNSSKTKTKASESKRRLSNTSSENDEASSFRHPTTLNFPSHAAKQELPAVGEESSTASSTPIRSHPSPPSKAFPDHKIDVPAEIHKNPSTNSLESTPIATEIKAKPSRSSHKRFASNVDGKIFSQSTNASFKGCKSSVDLDTQITKTKVVEISSPTHKRVLSQTHSIDPITQDVERRMSTKDHHSTLGSSSRSDDASRDQSLHSLHNSFDHARAMLRSYGNVAQVFFRGAYQKARNIVNSRYFLLEYRKLSFDLSNKTFYLNEILSNFSFLAVLQNVVLSLVKTMRD